MKTALPLSLITVALGLALAPGQSHAANAQYISIANGPALCQAFTPGPANTLRNRVVGAENVGSAPMNVACDFTSRVSSGVSSTQVWMYFANNNASGDISVTCSMLTGYQTGTNRLATKTVTVPAGAQKSVTFLPTDLAAGLTNFDAALVGVNCTLPPGGVINDTYFYYNEENGVGS